MTDSEPFKICPCCQSRRPVAELSCENTVSASPCGWDIALEAIHEPEIGESKTTEDRPGPQDRGALVCRNGHPFSYGDLFCLICDDDLSSSASQSAAKSGVEDSAPASSSDVGLAQIAGWEVVEERPTTFNNQQHFVVCRPNEAGRFLLTLFQAGSEPDPVIHDLVRRFSPQHVPAVYETGHWAGQAYEVCEWLNLGSVRDLQIDVSDIPTIEQLVAELGQVLSNFSEAGLRHRDIRPETILVRTVEPLDLVVSGFGAACLSDLDLDIAAPIETGRYAAPETVMGGVSAASDWWGLGMVLLDKITNGDCFAGSNDQLLMIHMFTHGAPVPNGLHPRLDQLLQGLLTVDRTERWHWKHVQRWLKGEEVPVFQPASVGTSSVSGPSIRLDGKDYYGVLQFSLAAARGDVWDEACDLLERGAIAGWVRSLNPESRSLSALEQLTSRTDIPSDFRLAIGLQLLNPSLPIILKEAIVSPAWMLANPESGYALLSGPVPELLLRFGLQSQLWILQLAKRLDSAKKRAESLGIQLDEGQFRFCSVVSSRAQLSAIWEERRQLLPDANLASLSSIIDRRNYSEEDLVILSSATVGQFRSVDEVITATLELASERSLDAPDINMLSSLVQQPRLQLYHLLEQRTEGFARCEIALVDEWVDKFRIRRRLNVEQLLIILTIQEEVWIKPPYRSYIASLLNYFEKKVSGSVLRGPLVKMTLGKTTARIDITELAMEKQEASSILERILGKPEKKASISPEIFENEVNPQSRLRKLKNQSEAYQRDTGVNGQYLGFPFVVLNDQPTKRQPRLAPVLLWPVALKSSMGRADPFYVAFDSSRGEVRLNPAFDGLLGSELANDWREAANSLMTQASIGIPAAMDAFGLLATVAGRELVTLPDKNAVGRIRHNTLVPAAVLFHVEFIGQSLVEDLRLLPQQMIDGTALETMLRITAEPKGRRRSSGTNLRFLVADSDPSQENAIAQASGEKGVVIQGPPGTGKSQTIVNLVADAIGQQKSVLVVCQKLPALEVVKKRLEAHGLRDRICMVTDVNRDREPIVRDIREQIDQLAAAPVGIDPDILRQRRDLQRKILAIENDVNQLHYAGQSQDEVCGRSYLSIINELLSIELEHGTDVPNVAGIRKLLSEFSGARLELLEESCADVGLVWLSSDFENSPYRDLRDVPHDAATLSEFSSSLEALHSAEEARGQTLQQTPGAIQVKDPDIARSWLDANEDFFKTIPFECFDELPAKLNCFGDESKGSLLIRMIRDLKDLYVAQTQACQEVQSLRFLLSTCPEDRIREYAEHCGQLSTHWLVSRFDDTPLQQMRNEKFDAASIAAFQNCLQQLASAEEHRQAVCKQPIEAKEPASTVDLERWLEQHGETLLSIDAKTAARIGDLYRFFQAAPNKVSRGTKQLAQARDFSNRLKNLGLSGYSASIGRLVTRISAPELLYWHKAASFLVESPSRIDQVTVDDAMLSEFDSSLEDLHSAEKARWRTQHETPNAIHVENPSNGGSWLDASEDFSSAFPVEYFDELQAKVHCFSDESKGSLLVRTIRDLKDLYQIQRQACQEVPSLRLVLSTFPEDRIREYAEHCGQLSTHWLASRFDDTPLQQMRNEKFDAESIAAFQNCLQQLASAEEHRQAVIQQPFRGREPGNTVDLERWMEQHGETLRKIDVRTAPKIRQLYLLFQAAPNNVSKGTALLAQARDFSSRLKNLTLSGYTASIGRLATGISASELLYWHKAARFLVESPSLFDQLNPARFLAFRRARQILSQSSVLPDMTNVKAFGEALLLEFQVMDIRRDWVPIAGLDITEPSEVMSPVELAENIESALQDLEITQLVFTALEMCPLRIRVDSERLNNLRLFPSIIIGVESLVRRSHARVQSLDAIEAVRQWMSEQWCQQASEIVSTNTLCPPGETCPIAALCECIPILESFRNFRSELKKADSNIHSIFEALSPLEGRIKELEKSSSPYQLVRAYVLYNGLIVKADRLKSLETAIACYPTGTEEDVALSLHALEKIEQIAKITKNANTARFLAFWRARQILSQSSVLPDMTNVRALGEALLIEFEVIDIRRDWVPIAGPDIDEQSEVISPVELAENIDVAIHDLEVTHLVFTALEQCPLEITIYVEWLNNPSSFHNLKGMAELLVRRSHARTHSLEAIEAARQWMSREWCQKAAEWIFSMGVDDRPVQCPVQAVIRAMPTVESFITFRDAVTQSGSVIPKLFDALSAQREHIEELADSSSPDEVVRTYVLFNGLCHQTDSLRKTLQPLAGISHFTQDEVSSSLRSLEEIEEIARRLHSCPCGEAERVHLIVSPESLQKFFRRLKDGIRQGESLCRSKALAEDFSKWVSTAWIAKLNRHLESKSRSTSMTSDFRDALPSLKNFLVFRSRESGFSEEQQQCFSELSKIRDFLSSGGTEAAGIRIRSVIRREALLAWKARLESERPLLLIKRPELDRKIDALRTSVERLKQIDRKLLTNNFAVNEISPAPRWQSITQLRGSQKVSLREFFLSGTPLGLRLLRPVWLMIPDVVSQVLPRDAALFDVVVFDEASQMPVEHSIPSLFRARTVVVSGDEKQMPPSSFFSGQMESDETESGNEEFTDDELTDAARDALEEEWNRREIKDCPDLLHLAESVLPRTMLQIHYRSRYRELISFSNAAYYRNQLSVPVIHPDKTILEQKPIEFIAVEGIYDKQTNLAEAKRVVAYVESIWKEPVNLRPSLGVVTFNKKQAELIEELLQTKAEKNVEFRYAMKTEQDRRDNGEDMSFFVKNVENVQGDERDLIVFSTTFGKNKVGAFRRNFGVLGQNGGERRLNVAITRARIKVALVTSMPVQDVSDMLNVQRAPVSPRDFLQGYLEYARLISSGRLEEGRRLASRMNSGRRTEYDSEPPMSGLRKSVFEYLSSLGYTVHRPEPDPVLGLDFAIIDPDTGLFSVGIECDPPTHKLLETARAREIWRHELLSSKYQAFIRVSGSDWLEDRDAEQRRIVKEIQTVIGANQ